MVYHVSHHCFMTLRIHFLLYKHYDLWALRYCIRVYTKHSTQTSKFVMWVIKPSRAMYAIVTLPASLYIYLYVCVCVCKCWLKGLKVTKHLRLEYASLQATMYNVVTDINMSCDVIVIIEYINDVLNHWYWQSKAFRKSRWRPPNWNIIHLFILYFVLEGRIAGYSSSCSTSRVTLASKLR